MDPTPTRRSSRQVAKPDFRALDGADEDEDFEAYSSEQEEPSRKRKGPIIKGGAPRGRQKKVAGLDDLETAAAEAEAQVAELTPQVEAWKEKCAALEAENTALKQRVEELSAGGALAAVVAEAVPVAEAPIEEALPADA